MKRLAIKTLVGAVALATLIAAPALAKPLRSAAPGYGQDPWVSRDPYAVIGPRGTVKGRDPDPFIRWSIYRGYWEDNSED